MALLAAKEEAKEELKRSHSQLRAQSKMTFDETGGLPLDDVNGAIYERMVLIVPYKAPQEVKQIQSSFERINLQGLKLDNARYLNTKELSEAEKADRMLDYLGGFELMDSEMRIFVIEGLGGAGHGMHQFYQANER